MAQMNYTKGEWSVVGQPNAYMVQARIPNKIHNLKLIADCFNNKEDAQLIASAPRMAEWLERVVVKQEGWIYQADLDEAKDILAKVESK